MKEHLNPIYQSVLSGDQNGVIAGVENALAEGRDPELIINQSMIAAMTERGGILCSGDVDRRSSNAEWAGDSPPSVGRSRYPAKR